MVFKKDVESIEYIRKRLFEVERKLEDFIKRMYYN
ncbi:hypothetical protein LCGC14_1898210 [marine sediment metagenome]|uniref:Uncharacterized protein n=1 Tax=marine sediment metagenome TaxID=412755 RepID=A0A0F9IVE3_9ZZZZ